jgi:hypothetical protein
MTCSPVVSAEKQAGLGHVAVALCLLDVTSVMRLLLSVLILTVPGLALAQSTGNSVTLTVLGEDSLVVGRSHCGETRGIDWTATVNGLACGDIDIWVTAERSCSSEGPKTSDLRATGRADPNLRSGTVSITINNGLPIFGGATDAGTTSCETFEGLAEMQICAQFVVATGGQVCPSNTKVPTSIPLTFDRKPPGAPTIEAVDSLDRALRVHVTVADNDTSVIQVLTRMATDGGGDFFFSGEFPSSQASGKIIDLENDVTYDVQAIALDKVGNTSVPSNIASGQPIYTLGFWDRYRNAGGQDTGGCTAAGGSVTGLSLALLAGLRLFSRRKRS